MNYFENCKIQEEVKIQYKELVKKYRPDIYGEKGNDILKEIHNQLEQVLKNIDKSCFDGTETVETDEIRHRKEELL